MLDDLLDSDIPTVYWLSRHPLSPSQILALRELHGADVSIQTLNPLFEEAEGLAEFIEAHLNSFVYAVAGPPHYLVAALRGLHFGVFENHFQKRQDGSFGLCAVWHIANGHIERVWTNPDPLSDEGERLFTKQ